MEMPNDLKSLPKLIAINQIIETFNDIMQAAENESPEIRAFVKPYSDRIVQVGASLRNIFGEDFLE